MHQLILQQLVAVHQNLKQHCAQIETQENAVRSVVAKDINQRIGCLKTQRKDFSNKTNDQMRKEITSANKSVLS